MSKPKKSESGKRGRRSDAASSADLGPLQPALRATLDWAKGRGYRAAVIGGVAVCLHGPVRPTRDVDVLILTDDAPQIVYDSLQADGFEPRYADTVAFAEASRTLLMSHASTDTPVDIILGMLPFDFESMDRSVVKRGKGMAVRVFNVESLCVMKLIAARERDLRDVALLIETYPKLDRAWIIDHMTQFAVAMEQPEALELARRMLGEPRSQG